MPQSEKTRAILSHLRGGLVVSCQAHEPDGLYGVDRMTDMAKAAEMGGASGIRADDPAHVRSIRSVTKLPIIGIFKEDYPGYATRITLNMDRAKEIYDAGADILAIEATDRPHPYNTTGFELISQVKTAWDVVVMADCSTIEEARMAHAAGADILATTMSGYTPYSPQLCFPDFKMLQQMRAEFPDAFLICEGRVNSPEMARMCLNCGANAVCVGSNITRPKFITERYVAALTPAAKLFPNSVLCFDVGGTKIAAAIVLPSGDVTHLQKTTTPQTSAEDVLSAMERLGDAVLLSSGTTVGRIGISAGGTIDSSGAIVYATDTLPGWKGFQLKEKISAHFQSKPTYLVNDGNAAALGEAYYGAMGPSCHSVLAVTVGTGFGAGLVVDGRLHYGSLDYAINMGAVIAQRDGRVSDKVSGALEAYASGRSIAVEYHHRTGRSDDLSGEAVGELAKSGDEAAVAAVREVAEWCGIGLATIVACHNPEVVLIGGGVACLGDLFMKPLKAAFAKHVFPALKSTRIELASLGGIANLVGASVYSQLYSH